MENCLQTEPVNSTTKLMKFTEDEELGEFFERLSQLVPKLDCNGDYDHSVSHECHHSSMNMYVRQRQGLQQQHDSSSTTAAVNTVLDNNSSSSPCCCCCCSRRRYSNSPNSNRCCSSSRWSCFNNKRNTSHVMKQHSGGSSSSSSLASHRQRHRATPYSLASRTEARRSQSNDILNINHNISSTNNKVTTGKITTKCDASLPPLSSSGCIPEQTSERGSSDFSNLQVLDDTQRVEETQLELLTDVMEYIRSLSNMLEGSSTIESAPAAGTELNSKTNNYINGVETSSNTSPLPVDRMLEILENKTRTITLTA